MKKLYFMRHGESEYNHLGLFAGRTETPLTDRGKNQARSAGESARKLHIDYIVSSPSSRALDTARIVAGAIGYSKDEIQQDDSFNERFFGVLEGQPWDPNLDLDNIPNVETSQALLERVNRGYEKLRLLPVGNVLIVSHGATGRALRHIIHPNVPYRGPESPRFKNADIVELI